MSSTHTYRALTEKRPLERLWKPPGTTARRPRPFPCNASFSCRPDSHLKPLWHKPYRNLAPFLHLAHTAGNPLGSAQQTRYHLRPVTMKPRGYSTKPGSPKKPDLRIVYRRRRKALTATPACALHDQRTAPLRALRVRTPVLSSKKPSSPREPGSYTIWRRRRDVRAAAPRRPLRRLRRLARCAANGSRRWLRSAPCGFESLRSTAKSPAPQGNRARILSGGGGGIRTLVPGVTG